jgi:hypothetical protein
MLPVSTRVSLLLTCPRPVHAGRHVILQAAGLIDGVHFDNPLYTNRLTTFEIEIEKNLVKLKLE